MMDENDPNFMPLYEEMENSFEAAWQAALKVNGCVECARVELVQRLLFMADAKAHDIVGEQSMDEAAPVPEEKDGIRRTCELCQHPPPPGSIRFFKHGTDERI